jgi:tetratricopeptide (TPR) repeat protein
VHPQPLAVPDEPAPIYSDTSREEEPTDRRDFLELTALSLTAAEILRRTPGGTDALTIADLESDADTIATTYGSAPHVELLPYVADRWRRAEEIRASGLSPLKRPRVNLLAGQYAYFLGRLAFNTHDFQAARRFAELAGSYADDTREPVLLLSVAALHSSIAYHTQRYRAAVDALNAVSAVRHPYMDARIAAYHARAYAKQGDHANALAALDRMEATACTVAPVPGETPVGPAAVAMFRSTISLMIGHTDMAREWAPIAITGYRTGGGDFTTEEAQHAEITTALLLLSGRAPEPEEAARRALRLVTNAPGPITHTVATRVRQCLTTFSPAQRRLPGVAALIAECRALPAASLGR